MNHPHNEQSQHELGGERTDSSALTSSRSSPRCQFWMQWNYWVGNLIKTTSDIFKTSQFPHSTTSPMKERTGLPWAHRCNISLPSSSRGLRKGDIQKGGLQAYLLVSIRLWHLME